MALLTAIQNFESPEEIFTEIAKLKEFSKYYSPGDDIFEELVTRIHHLETVLLQALVFCNDTNEEWLKEQGVI